MPSLVTGILRAEVGHHSWRLEVLGHSNNLSWLVDAGALGKPWPQECPTNVRNLLRKPCCEEPEPSTRAIKKDVEEKPNNAQQAG